MEIAEESSMNFIASCCLAQIKAIQSQKLLSCQRYLPFENLISVLYKL